MKNNFVSKHMNTFNKASVHKDLRKEFLMDDEEHIEEGIQEVLNEDEREELDDQ